MNKILKYLVLIVGVLIFIIGVILGIQNIVRQMKYQTTTGIVIDVYETKNLSQGYDSKNLYDWKLDIKYKVDENEYNTSLFHNKMNIGDEIEIMYQINNPEYVIFKSSTFTYIAFLIFGLIFIAFDRLILHKRL